MPEARAAASRLQRGVVAERDAGLLRLDEAERGRADGLDAVGPEEFADLAQLAGVVGRRDDAPGNAASAPAVRASEFIRPTILYR